MESSFALAVPAFDNRLEDPLAHLPYSKVIELRKGHVIYDCDRGPSGLYLVIDGKVKVSQHADPGHEVIIDIYRPDEFFGETALLSMPHRFEQAIALEHSKLMMWPATAFHEIVVRRPRLALALLQILIQRTITLKERIESLSADTIKRRLARSLIRFSEHLGITQEDGSVVVAPFTHELLAQYVCTSREVITLYMNQFRREGFVRYTRKAIVLHRDALKEWLRQNV